MLANNSRPRTRTPALLLVRNSTRTIFTCCTTKCAAPLSADLKLRTVLDINTS